MKESLRQRKKTRTRRAIFEEASRIFLEKGFEATTLEEIAEAADIHKQTVLRYYRSKEEIAFGLRIRIYERFVERLAERPGSVLEYWRAYITETSSATSPTNELAEWFAFLDSDVRLFAFQLRLNERYQEVLAEAFSREAGIDPDHDWFARSLAALLVAGNSNVARITIKNGEPRDLTRNLLAVVDLAAQLERPPAPPPQRKRKKAATGAKAVACKGKDTK